MCIQSRIGELLRAVPEQSTRAERARDEGEEKCIKIKCKEGDADCKIIYPFPCLDCILPCEGDYCCPNGICPNPDNCEGNDCPKKDDCKGGDCPKNEDCEGDDCPDPDDCEGDDCPKKNDKKDDKKKDDKKKDDKKCDGKEKLKEITKLHFGPLDLF